MNQRQTRPAGVLGFVHSLAERVLGAVLRVETIKRRADLVCLLENLIVQRRRQSHGRLKRSLPNASLAGGAGCRAAGRRRSRGAGDDSPSAMPAPRPCCPAPTNVLCLEPMSRRRLIIYLSVFLACFGSLKKRPVCFSGFTF